jgi:hypothetical protein
MKVPLENVEEILLKKKIDPAKIQEILKDLTKAAEEEKEEREANKVKTKWEYVIVLNDKDGLLKDKEIAGWVVQQRDGQDAGLILSKLADAAKAQNDSAKRKKFIIDDLAGLFEGLKSAFAKEKGLRVKTKELTRVVVTDGKL